jgi:hypothetical protein
MMIKTSKNNRKRFHTRAGCEYTFIPVCKIPARKGRSMYDLGYTPDLLKYFKIVSHKFGPHSDIRKRLHMDSGVIEMPTKIISDYDQLKSEYVNRAKAAKLLKCVPKHKTIQHGGSHIHLEMPKNIDADLFIKNFYIYSMNNPAVMWAFADPNDDRNKSLLSQTKLFNDQMIKHYSYNVIVKLSKEDGYFLCMCKFAKSCKKGFNAENNFGLMTMHHMLKNIKNTKCIMLYGDVVIRFRSELNTIELRCFDMVEDLNEAKRQMEFAQALWKYIYDVTSRGETLDMKILKHESLCDIKLDDSLEQFEQNLKMLGLDPFKYINQFKNLKTRYGFGKSYLV